MSCRLSHNQYEDERESRRWACPSFGYSSTSSLDHGDAKISAASSNGVEIQLGGNRATRSTDECVRLNGKTLAGPPKPRTGPGYFRSVDFRARLQFGKPIPESKGFVFLAAIAGDGPPAELKDQACSSADGGEPGL